MIYLSKKEFSELYQKHNNAQLDSKVPGSVRKWWLSNNFRKYDTHNIESEYQLYRSNPGNRDFYYAVRTSDNMFVTEVLDKHDHINKLHLIKNAMEL